MFKLVHNVLAYTFLQGVSIACYAEPCISYCFYQMAAELISFVEKFEIAASAILNNYLAILDHPQSLLWCWSSLYFSRYRDLRIWLKTPVQSPKLHFWGF